jgi:hypothetical protein
MHSPDTLPANHATLTNLRADLKLIRAALLMLLFMTAAFSGATWNAMQNDLTVLKSMEAIPVALISVVSIIVARMYTRADEIAKVFAHFAHDQESATAQREG